MRWIDLEAGDVILVEGKERVVVDIEFTDAYGTEDEDPYVIELKAKQACDLDTQYDTWFNTIKHPWTFVRKKAE